MTTEVGFRKAVPADIPALVRIHRQGDAGGDSESRMVRYLEGEHHPQQALPPRVMWLAAEGDSPIGYAAGHLTRRFGCDAELQWIYVIPERRRARVALKLLRLMAEWPRTRGAPRLCRRGG